MITTSEIVVHVASATICFLGHCHPALVGAATPLGSFPLMHAKVGEPGYGGDVLAFAHDDTGVYAIHRVWTLIPAQRRVKRLTVGAVAERLDITGGCINVMPDVYDSLVDCCERAGLTVMK
jgi:hypothetical protein